MRVQFIVGVSVVVLSGAACSSVEDEQDPYAIQTDHSRYTVTEAGSGRHAYVEVSIPMLFTNRTGDIVYFVGCNRPPRPVLQRLEDGSWVTAWASVEQSCLTPPWALPPGGTLRDTVQIQGYLPGRSIFPTFNGDVPGLYRLVREVHTGSDPLSPLIQERWRSSNEFSLNWAEP